MKGTEAARLRILLFDDNALVRSLVGQTLCKQGWEVLSYPNPAVCPLRKSASCRCEQVAVCADAIVTDLEMPHIDGLSFVRELLQKGCRIHDLALLTETQDTALLEEARRIGFAVFKKADGTEALLDWLRHIEARLGSGRRLAQWAEA